MFMQNFWATNKEHYGMLGYLLVCTWRHGGHVGGQEQKHFSPLWTKLYFQINSSRKTIYCVDLQRGCPVTWLQFSITRATGFPDVVCVKYRVFSHDVTAAILVSQNNETAAMLVSQTSPVGVELFSYANAFFCSNKFAYMLATWVKTLYINI